MEYTLPQHKQFAARTQITRHTCEEGLTAIAEWTGLPLGTLITHAGISRSARFVNFYSYDGRVDSIDLLDVFAHKPSWHMA